MITISQAVQEEIESSAWLQVGLKLDMLNLSAVARELKPVIEERTFKDVSTNAVQLALQRLDKQRLKIEQAEETAIKQMSITNHLVSVVGPTQEVIIAAAQALSTVPTDSTLQPLLFCDNEQATLIYPKELEAAVRLKLKKSGHVQYDKSLLTIELTNKSTSVNASALSHNLFWRSIETDLLNINGSIITVLVDGKKAKGLANLLQSLVKD